MNPGSLIAAKETAPKIVLSVRDPTNTLQREAIERKPLAMELLEKEFQEQQADFLRWRSELQERRKTVLRDDLSTSGSMSSASHLPSIPSPRKEYRPSPRESPAGPARPLPASSTAIRMATQMDFGDSLGRIDGSQVAARHAVPKELPVFNGDPEQWPNFLTNFNRSTMMCGFSADENVMRLEKSLRSKAYETVKPLLQHPNNVEKLIATLKMRFGQLGIKRAPKSGRRQSGVWN
uniref:Uncharacterized protein n=1 Tax=Anopheles albimanus TaxID=7167 RepID=A0A182FKG9_ANOAL